AAIRKGLLEDDLVEAMIALPDQLFYSTPIPVCVWIITRNKALQGQRNRIGEILFIDARKMGRMVDRVHRELTDDDIQQIAGTFHRWRGVQQDQAYQDVAGFCK